VDRVADDAEAASQQADDQLGDENGDAVATETAATSTGRRPRDSMSLV